MIFRKGVYLSMPKSILVPKGLPKAIAPYSAGTAVDGAIYVSGMLSLTDDGTVAYPGDVSAQTRHILEMIRVTLAEAGGTMADITFNHVFLTDWANYDAINAVYAEYFPSDRPARYCVQCGLAKADLLVEIASIAHVAPPVAGALPSGSC